MAAPARLRVLTVCRHGAGRSQVAAAAIAQMLGPAAVELRVAGTAPKVPERPIPDSVLTILEEVGLSPAQDRCRALTQDDLAWANVVLCFAERSTWPAWLPEQEQMHVFEVADGSGQTLEFQREMRDEVLRLVATVEWPGS